MQPSLPQHQQHLQLQQPQWQRHRARRHPQQRPRPPQQRWQPPPQLHLSLLQPQLPSAARLQSFRCSFLGLLLLGVW
jgi:hypothetical protein